MRVLVPRETATGEHRVALTPDAVQRLTASGFEVAVERGAGAQAHFGDEAYEAAGATRDRDGPETPRWSCASPLPRRRRSQGSQRGRC